MTFDFSNLELWFITGSQHLYGEETLKQVERHSDEIVRGLNAAGTLPVNVVAKPVLTTADAIHQLTLDANSSKRCIGLVCWMHTFSPAKMWIAGLRALAKPFVHLHTQFYRDLPWSAIDMDFMNLHQSAHGDREFGFLASRMRLNRKVIVGFWQDGDVLAELGIWSRSAAAWHDAQSMKVARFGDNMRNVAVTEGDKVEAQLRLRYSVQAYGVGDLVARVDEVSDTDAQRLTAEYDDSYDVDEELRSNGDRRSELLDAARIELGLRRFLDEGKFTAFTDNFENLHGLKQLPGIAVQRLMADGYGFGGEGDWKTAALVRTMKVMAAGLDGGTSFMEDYTYHLRDSGQVLGAHMLEVCPSIADGKPAVEIHPLSIGGKADPVRLVFTGRSGPALNASMVDVGERFRLVVNTVDVVAPPEPLPKLPVARVLWNPHPNLRSAATAWILAGGAHHTGFSQALTLEHLENYAEMAGLEFLVIDSSTTIANFKKELRWNDAAFRLGHL